MFLVFSNFTGFQAPVTLLNITPEFTFKMHQNNQINFLDLSLIIKENQIISNWFQ